MVPTRNRDEYLVVPEAKSDTQTRTGLHKHVPVYKNSREITRSTKVTSGHVNKYRDPHL